MLSAWGAIRSNLYSSMQALAAAQRGVAKLEAAGVPWRRPTDYYAEMVKSDDHMLKVKEQLMFQQKQIKETEQR